ncbi:TetR/AcrR family transcriptional regulator [Roseateles sp. GG27B]
MRYPNEYNTSTCKLVDAGGRHAKRNGFISSGMADLAAAAGVTTGSLYKHFSGSRNCRCDDHCRTERTADMYAAVDAADPERCPSLSGSKSWQHPERGAHCPLHREGIPRRREIGI